MIWYCVDGTSGKQLPKTLDNLSKATSFWSSVPVIVVITKSYVTAEREANILLVRRELAKMKKRAAQEDVEAFALKRNRALAQGVTALATGAADLVAAVPIPFPDASAFIFEQISLGNRTVDDIDWIKKVLESELTSTVLRKLREVVEKTDGKMTAKDITRIITGVFFPKKKKDSTGEPFVVYSIETRI